MSVKCRNLLSFCLTTTVILMPQLAAACESCKGNPDSPMTAGMNAAIFAMFGVTQFVLGGFIWFFIQIRKKSKNGLTGNNIDDQND